MSDTLDRAESTDRAPAAHGEVRTSRLADGNWVVASVPAEESPRSRLESDRRERDSTEGA